MHRTAKSIFLISLIASFVAAANAQSATKAANDKDDLGWTSAMSFEGSANSQERILDLDSNVGYNFNQHWGVDVGVPLDFNSASYSTTTTTAGGGSTQTSTSSSNNSIGNIYTDVRFKANGDVLNYASTLKAAAPTGSVTNGISTGRAAISWNNHFAHEFDRLTPFVEVALANGVTDTRYFHRPFTSLGFVSQFTGGSEIDLGHDVSIGGSLYDLLPSGQQKVYSKLVSAKSGVPAGTGKHGRSWELAAKSVGDASLTRDNGGSAWIEFAPGKVFDFQIGYTHSVHYALDTVAFNVGVNLGKLVRKANRY